MEFMPQASWGAKFQWRNQRKNFARNTSVRGTCAELSAKELETMKIFILLTAAAVMLSLGSCASEEPVATTTTTTHETTTVAPATQQTTTTRTSGY
jgi:hypothetical protein